MWLYLFVIMCLLFGVFLTKFSFLHLSSLFSVSPSLYNLLLSHSFSILPDLFWSPFLTCMPSFIQFLLSFPHYFALPEYFAPPSSPPPSSIFYVPFIVLLYPLLPFLALLYPPLPHTLLVPLFLLFIFPSSLFCSSFLTLLLSVPHFPSFLTLLLSLSHFPSIPHSFDFLSSLIYFAFLILLHSFLYSFTPPSSPPLLLSLPHFFAFTWNARHEIWIQDIYRVVTGIEECAREMAF